MHIQGGPKSKPVLTIIIKAYIKNRQCGYISHQF